MTQYFETSLDIIILQIETKKKQQWWVSEIKSDSQGYELIRNWKIVLMQKQKKKVSNTPGDYLPRTDKFFVILIISRVATFSLFERFYLKPEVKLPGAAWSNSTWSN
jgi:hypothetical protein